MTFGSWTHDSKSIDYFYHNKSGTGAIGTDYCIDNEGWNILSTNGNFCLKYCYGRLYIFYKEESFRK